MSLYFKCVANFYMVGGAIAFTKGEVYPANYLHDDVDGYPWILADDDCGVPDHYMSQDLLDIHFVSTVKDWYNPTATGFTKYCISQKNTKLNHDIWGTCAVGCYIRSCGINMPVRSMEITPAIIPRASSAADHDKYSAQCTAVHYFVKDLRTVGVRGYPSLYHALNSSAGYDYADLVRLVYGH